MTLSQLKLIFKKKLPYNEKENLSIFYLFIESFFGFSKTKIILEPDYPFYEKDLLKINKVISELKSYKPIQYILNKCTFLDLCLTVNENVLIPRPETEELVLWLLKYVKERWKTTTLKILDIGTGSGAIAISIAKSIKNAKITAIDISYEAIKVASENAKKHRVDIQFITKDILTLQDLNKTFDVIISNPPYVTLSEKEQIKRNVLHYEPQQAIFVNSENTLLFYEKIITLAAKNLSPQGVLFLEINKRYGNKILNIIKNQGFKKITLKKDLYENDRFIMGIL